MGCGSIQVFKKGEGGKGVLFRRRQKRKEDVGEGGEGEASFDLLNIAKAERRIEGGGARDLFFNWKGEEGVD